MGSGKIFSLHISNPQQWGLGAHTNQLVVWLCATCAKTSSVEFDRKHHEVHVVKSAAKNPAVA